MANRSHIDTLFVQSLIRKFSDDMQTRINIKKPDLAKLIKLLGHFTEKKVIDMDNVLDVKFIFFYTESFYHAFFNLPKSDKNNLFDEMMPITNNILLKIKIPQLHHTRIIELSDLFKHLLHILLMIPLNSPRKLTYYFPKNFYPTTSIVEYIPQKGGNIYDPKLGIMFLTKPSYNIQPI